MFVSDTVTDQRPYDAMLRTLPYLDAKLAAQVTDARPQAANGAEWAEWSAHHAFTTVSSEPAVEMGQPSDTPFDAYRKWSVTVVPHGRDGWEGQPSKSIVYTTLSRRSANDVWVVSAITVD